MTKFRKFRKLEVKPHKIPISLRIREDINKILNYVLESTGISKIDFCEIALIEHCLRFDIDLKYEGIDFKKYLEILKYEKLRVYQAKIRSSILSKALFLNRVRIDLIKLTSLNASRNDIIEYLEEREKEASLYPNSDNLLKEYKKYVNRSDFKFKEFEKTIKEDIDSIKKIEHDTKIHLE